MSGDRVLVVDVGTSSVRSSIVDREGAVSATAVRPTPPDVGAGGSVSFDPSQLRDAALSTAAEVLASAGPVAGVGVAVQRASTVVWDRRTGEPLGPGLGWQDLRTVGRCLELRAEGVRLAPNVTATKAEWLLDQLDVADRARAVVGTIDAWMAWSLTEGRCHLTDATNAAVTGLASGDAWSAEVLDVLGIDRDQLPEIVDTAGPLGEATALSGAPPLLALVGDQQASLVGQGCVSPGRAKLTFGTGGMLDQVADGPVDDEVLGREGCFGIVAWRHGADRRLGVEAVMLAAGAHVDWLIDGLGLAADHDELGALAAEGDDLGGGVVFVPALSGLGTPHWDHGARGTLLGLSRGTSRADVVRAVLRGVAQRGVDLVLAAERATGSRVAELRIDGGMTANGAFVQLLADAAGRPVLVSDEREATTRGAGLLAGVGAGWWPDVTATNAAGGSGHLVEPAGPSGRERWPDALERARGWLPELSALEL